MYNAIRVQVCTVFIAEPISAIMSTSAITALFFLTMKRTLCL